MLAKLLDSITQVPQNPALIKPRHPSMFKLIKTLLFLVLFAPVVLYFSWRLSLPKLDGEIQTTGLSQTVQVQRDSLGRVSIQAENELDAWFAAAYITTQDRFFQMDLLRRSASGELAALFGPQAVKLDKKRRLHGLQQVARDIITRLNPSELALLQSYTQGVNASLQAMEYRPFEYVLLNQTPAAWRIQDSLMVIFSMFFDLTDETGQLDRDLATLHQALPPSLFDFLTHDGSEWDAALDNSHYAMPQIPEILSQSKPSEINTGTQPAPPASGQAAIAIDPLHPGSNNWAVNGSRTKDGRALIANDMHLNLRVPHIWYPLHIQFKDHDKTIDATGVSLPGVPAIVAGSNTKVAWGFTNSYIDTTDIIQIQWLDEAKTAYATAEGPKQIELRTERIAVHDSTPVEYSVQETIWGPVLPDTNYAIHWLAHRPEATNLSLSQFVKTESLQELLALANQTGAPPQNLVAADQHGQIGWTLMGRIPIRQGFNPKLPADWSLPETGWMGWHRAEDIPRVVEPETGQIWTANSRVIGGEAFKIIGDGGYALGARSKQIRDRLSAKDILDESDLLAIQLDDEALFLKRWQQLALKTSQDKAFSAETLNTLKNWHPYASIQSIGYRLVSAFRSKVLSNIQARIFNPYFSPEKSFTPKLSYFEDRAWQLIQQNDQAFFAQPDQNWQKLLRESLDQALSDISANSPKREDQTWGHRNTLKMQHPLSQKLPWIALVLDMPAQQLPGGHHMPRVQSTRFGASQRFVVSPGHEAEAYSHMPGGVSGHPLSPFYRAGHDDWVQGKPTAFLHGPAQHHLTLQP